MRDYTRRYIDGAWVKPLDGKIIDVIILRPSVPPAILRYLRQPMMSILECRKKLEL